MVCEKDENDVFLPRKKPLRFLCSVLVHVDSLLVRTSSLVIRLWQTLFSPLFGERCRFHPTCSRYAAEALEKHGFLRGAELSCRRILRCNSLFEGGVDPVPEPRRNREE